MGQKTCSETELTEEVEHHVKEQLILTRQNAAPPTVADPRRTVGLEASAGSGCTETVASLSITFIYFVLINELKDNSDCFQMFSLTMHFSYTNHVVVQNIYISTSRRGGQHERTHRANHEGENNTSRPEGKYNKLFVNKVSLVSPPFVNKTLHLRCKHQYRVDHVRERYRVIVQEGRGRRNRQPHECEVTESHCSLMEQRFLLFPM